LDWDTRPTGLGLRATAPRGSTAGPAGAPVPELLLIADITAGLRRDATAAAAAAVTTVGLLGLGAALAAAAGAVVPLG